MSPCQTPDPALRGSRCLRRGYEEYHTGAPSQACVPPTLTQVIAPGQVMAVFPGVPARADSLLDGKACICPGVSRLSRTVPRQWVVVSQVLVSWSFRCVCCYCYCCRPAEPKLCTLQWPLPVSPTPSSSWPPFLVLSSQHKENKKDWVSHVCVVFGYVFPFLGVIQRLYD